MGSTIGKKPADIVVSGQQLANNTITGNKLVDGIITAAKMAAGAVVAHLGYTPVNKAGDTMSGLLHVNSGLYSKTDLLKLAGAENARYNARIAFGDTNGSNGFGFSFGTTNNSIDYNDAMRIVDGRVTMPTQPYAAWMVGVINTNCTRTYSIKSSVGGCTSTTTPPQGLNPGSVVRFTAPVAGKYLVTITGSQISTSPPQGGTSQCLIIAAGSWSGAANSINAAQEVIDTRNAKADDLGVSFILSLAQGDYINPDFYNGYEAGGNICVTVQLIG